MPDILGPLYEAVLTHCLRLKGANVSVSAPRPGTTCEKVCPHATECARLGYEPSVDVDPDVLGTTAKGRHLVGFVTHWRTTGFEKKFWRTTEEILEHQTHRPNGVGISFVAEPISQSERLRVALGDLAGVDVDMTNVWDTSLQKAVPDLEDAVVKRDLPSEASGALEYVEKHASTLPPLAAYIEAVSSILAALPLKAACRIPSEQLYLMCIDARRRSKHWKIRPIKCSARTPAQLLALVLFAMEADGCELTEVDFTRGQVALARGGAFNALRVLAATPYRIAGKVKHNFITVVDTIRGPILRFEERAFPTEERTPGRIDLARAYLDYLKTDETWSVYLERLTRGMLGPTRQPSVQELSRDEAYAAVTAAVEHAKNGWELDLLVSAAELSQVRLASAADEAFEKATGSSLKSISAFGDEAKKVVSYCARNRSGDLHSAPGLTAVETLQALSSALWGPLDAAIQWPLSIESALEALCIRDMRTFLSGAPHPVLGAISVALRRRSIRHAIASKVSTVVTSWYGGNTGRTEYQFEIFGGARPLFLKVSTGQDGNEGHKWKELAGRVRAHRAVAGDVEVWLLLDGEWSDDALRKLYEAGYAKIFAVDEPAELERELAAWIQG